MILQVVEVLHIKVKEFGKWYECLHNFGHVKFE